MDSQLSAFVWSGSYTLGENGRSLPGDKILLPPSALEQLLAASPRVPVQSSHAFTAFDPYNPYSVSAAQRERSLYNNETQQQLPQPLMFRLRNQQNGDVVYAGIREFSAEEGQVVLSPYLKEALGLQETQGTDANNGTSNATAIDLNDETTTTPSHGTQITVSARQLPKGSFVRIRPLEAGYNPDDWKSLLERQFRESFTTLTKGAMFSVRGVKGETFRFLIDEFKPEGEGICVVDTDLEVEIEALNEEQARETLKKIMNNGRRHSDTAVRSSPGGQLDVWKPVVGQVVQGDYVDYDLPSWNRSQPLQVELTGLEDGAAVDLLVSPKSARQRAHPRISEHVFAEFGPAKDGAKQITIQPTNVEMEGADGLLIAVYAWTSLESESGNKTTHAYTIRARSMIASDLKDESAASTTAPQGAADEEQCKNCLQWIPQRTLVLHENFCLRNNILCPKCQQVFQKRSEEWQAHWHCEADDGGFGNTAESKAKHDLIFHTPQQCPSESCAGIVFSSLPELARHRTSTCPGKLILCQFCHLEVPQEGDPHDPTVEAETVLTGLTPHERADGARTTDCHLCGSIVRLRDMSAHLQHHELDKQSRIKPEVCRNELCGRTLYGVGPKGRIGGAGQGPGNSIGLCSICFGPLYVSAYDPEGKALRRRIERRYLSQLLTGCGKKACANEWCKSGRANLGLESRGSGTSTISPLIKPLVAEMNDHNRLMHFCVDEATQKRRKLSEMLAAEGGWDLEWCVAACEAEGANLDKAREWLINWAPTKGSQR